jgi:hypothetical protein
MIKSFLKYLIYSLYNYSYKRAKKNSVVSKFSAKISFGFIVSLIVWLLLIPTLFFFHFPVRKYIIYSIPLVILLGTVLIFTVNFESIKNIKLEEKEIKRNKIILITLIVSIFLLRILFIKYKP